EYNEKYKEIFMPGDYLEELIAKTYRNIKEGGNGEVKADPIYINLLGHELIHAYRGDKSGGMINECMAHCLTKKCLSPDQDFRKKTAVISGNNTWAEKELECDSEEVFGSAEGKQNEDSMGSRCCFCDLDWKHKEDPTSARCKDKNYRKNCDNNNKPGEMAALRNDTPDDNYSFFNAPAGDTGGDNPDGILGEEHISEYICSYYPDILIYTHTNSGDIHRLLQRYAPANYTNDIEHSDFLNTHKILVIPSGELMGDRQSELVKAALQRFVEKGNSLVVLSQQYGVDISELVPIPQESSLQAYGFREDSSCLKNSVYFSGMHPVLSSATNELLDAGV
ncbi:MAG: hypothetical protein L0Y73_03030, partial [Candidatus Aminicenantes bacterium]|nr:hypothetical protein [Candidatus Aminicenantes bacterium]